MATRKNVHKEARRSGLEEDWLRFKILKREIKREICQAEQEYFNQEISAYKNNSSGIWKTTRRALPNKSKQCTQYTTDTKVLANEFKHFFTSVGGKTAEASVDLLSCIGCPISLCKALSLHCLIQIYSHFKTFPVPKYVRSLWQCRLVKLPGMTGCHSRL